MPTASSYITTTGQSGGDVSWTSLSNADGAPDGAVATCEVPDGDTCATIAFTHAITIPHGATIDDLRFVVRWADSASEDRDYEEAEFRLNGAKVAGPGGREPPQGSLADDTLDNGSTVSANATVANINAGVGTLSLISVAGDAVLIVDSIQIQVDYTEASTRGKRHSRSCSRSCAFSPAKKPTEY